MLQNRIKTELDVEPVSLVLYIILWRKAKVQIIGFFLPDWGLYSGSMGEVIENVCKGNENVKDNSFSQYSPLAEI